MNQTATHLDLFAFKDRFEQQIPQPAMVYGMWKQTEIPAVHTIPPGK